MGLGGSWGGPERSCGGSWGLLKGLWGEECVLGVSGGFEEAIWEGPGSVFFYLLGGEFAHGIVKYWCFSFWVFLCDLMD